MGFLSICPRRLAADATRFLDTVERLGYVLPPARFTEDSVRRPQAIPLFDPLHGAGDRPSVVDLFGAFEVLESHFNPRRLRHSHRDYTGQLTAWVDSAVRRAQAGCPIPIGSETTLNWRAAYALAMVTDTLYDWWKVRLHVDWHTGDRSGSWRYPTSNLGMISLPRCLVRAMREVVAALPLEDDLFNDSFALPPPPPPPVPLHDAHGVATRLVLVASAMSWVTDPTLLLSLWDDLLEARCQLQTAALGPCDCQDIFQEAGVIAASAHKATLLLTDAISARMNSFALHARCRRWGPHSFRIGLPLGWEDDVATQLPAFVHGQHPVCVSTWVAHLEVEASRLRVQSSGVTPLPAPGREAASDHKPPREDTPVDPWIGKLGPGDWGRVVFGCHRNVATERLKALKEQGRAEQHTQKAWSVRASALTPHELAAANGHLENAASKRVKRAELKAK